MIFLEHLNIQKLISVRRAYIALGAMVACVLALNVNSLFAAFLTGYGGTAGCLAYAEPAWLHLLYYFNISLVSMAVPTVLTLVLNLAISAVIVVRVRRRGHLHQHSTGIERAEMATYLYCIASYNGLYL